MVLESTLFAVSIILTTCAILGSLYLLCRHTRPSVDSKRNQKGNDIQLAMTDGDLVNGRQSMRRYGRLLSVLLTASLMLQAIPGAADAGAFEDGEAAYKGGDYATAMRLLGPLAEQGDAAAQYNLGVYAFGHGVPQSFTAAVTWYRKSADQGVPNAQYNLGFMYEKGLGVPQDYAEAAKLYRLAADQGTAVAQSNLGLMYQSGRGVPRSYPDAVKWFRRAADQGDSEAQSNLGVMYTEGQSLPRDYVQAFMWLDIAAAQDSSNRIKNNRDIVAERMTAAQIAEAQKLASEWKPKPER